MEYRKFGKLNWEISEISLGVLRQEEAAVAQSGICSHERAQTIRYAIDSGVNHINLGYPQYFSNPKAACGYVMEALGDGYRNRVKTAINIPSGDISSRHELDDALNYQLKSFDLCKADFCVIDDVNRATWNALKSIDIAAWASITIGSGKVDYIGLKYHDNPHFLKGIIDAFPHCAFIQIEFSLLDYKHHPGVGCFKYSDEHGIAVIATDVTKAGRLLRNNPENVQLVLQESLKTMTLEERCIRWALSFEDVSSAQMSVHTEMSSKGQIDRFLSYINRFSPGDVDIWEMLDAAKIREAYYSNRGYRCTACRCCTPCPAGIDMPRLVELVNDGIMFADTYLPKFHFQIENHQRTKCIKCGVCNKQCPKQVPLQKAVNEAFEKYAEKSR